MSNDEGNKPRSLREIAARAKEARSGAASSASASDLLGVLQARPSVPPPSAPPGSLGARPSQPPDGRPSSPPVSGRPSSPPVSSRPSAPPSGSPLAARPSGPPPSLPLPPVSSPPATLRTPPATAVPAAAEAAEATPEAKAPAPEAEQRSVTPILVGVGLIAAIGLGVVLTRKTEPTSVALGGASPVVASAEPRATAKPEVSATAKAVESAPPAVSADPGSVDINALGTAEPSARAAPRASGAAHHPGDDHKGHEVPTGTTSAPAEPVASAAPRPMGSVGELHDEMKKRVGATDQPEEQPGAGPGGNPNAKQEKPSNAAVLGALGAVRGAVKACIADTDKPTRISVTFQSNGSVKSVVVSGGAAGKPAEACVQAAVKKARVAPFAMDTFSTSFSVSP